VEHAGSGTSVILRVVDDAVEYLVAGYVFRNKVVFAFGEG
jgi:hypothetical protein